MNKREAKIFSNYIEQLIDLKIAEQLQPKTASQARIEFLKNIIALHLTDSEAAA